ncbi:MAG: alpha/beta fold hydrolase [Pseudomonadota bacterium]
MNNNTKFSDPYGSLRYEGGSVGILLLHSLGGAPMELKYLAQGLARCGYTVRCPVIPGMSHGTDVLGLSNWHDWYSSAEAQLDDMRKTCDTVLVGGLSAGSIVALKLAAERPNDVEGCLVCAPTLKPNGWSIPWTFNLFGLVWQRWCARLFQFRQRAPYGIKDERLRNFMIEATRSGNRSIEDLYSRNGGMVLQFRKLVMNVKRRLGQVTHPTLIMHPREDDQSHLKNALTIQARLGGPVEAIVLDDSYHMITLDRQRDVVLERSIDFVARLISKVDARRARNAPRVARPKLVSNVAAE